MKTSGCANTINSPEFLIIIYKRRYGCSNFTHVDFRFSLVIVFAIDPISVYKLIEVVHHFIKHTEIYISTELSEIAHD